MPKGAYQHQYHLVWIPKYRRRVLKGELKACVAQRLPAIHEFHPEVEVQAVSIPLPRTLVQDREESERLAVVRA